MFDIDISRLVAEYRAQTLEDPNGNRFVAPFPEGVTKALIWAFFYPHVKKGTEAFEAMGVLPGFKGTLIHDHRKPSYKIGCPHARCNAHHLGELTRAFAQDAQKWAEAKRERLVKIRNKVMAAGGALDRKMCEKTGANTGKSQKWLKLNVRSLFGQRKRARGAG